MHENYPKAEKRPYTYSIAGHKLDDPYAWFESNDADVHEFVALENKFTDEWFERNKGVVERKAQLAQRASKPVYSGVTECHGKLYAGRTSPAGDSAVVVMDRDFNELQLVMDDAKARGQFHAYSITPCPGNADLAAVFVLKNYAARPSVLIQNLATGETEACFDGIFSYVWSPDGHYLYFSDAQADLASVTAVNTVKSYDINTKEIKLLYTPEDSAVFLILAVNAEGELYVHVQISYVNIKVVRLNPATGRTATLTGTSDYVYKYVGSIGGTQYFFTDEHAPKAKLIAAEGDTLAGARVILPEKDLPLEDVLVSGDKLMAVYLDDVASVAKIYDKDGKFERRIELPDEYGALTLPMDNPMPGTKHIYLNFESFLCAPSVLLLDTVSGGLKQVYSQGKLGKRPGVTVERKEYTARDGQRIMAFLVHKTGLRPDGQVPTLMYGYGGYNAVSNPWYTDAFMGQGVADWADRGGLYVHCIIRGGGEFGAAWHEAGYLGNKKNAFFDFIDIAENLIKDGWTNPKKIAINGGSNGGLLVTALVTLRPDLFGVVIASVPHTDMIRFCYDERGSMYITEYGDPRDPEMFEYMLSYSPYHNIQPGVEYPPIYVQTGEYDNNVPPYHGKKFAAKMQDMGGHNPCLLRVLAHGFHDRGTGDVYYQTCSEMQIFMEKALGM
jgi:prolyl oligopeptidase